MNLPSTDFELFGIPVQFAQDRAQLDARWKELQREALEDAENMDDLDKIARESITSGRKQLLKIEQTLDQEKDFAAAAKQVRSLMFIERFASEVDARIDQLGQ